MNIESQGNIDVEINAIANTNVETQIAGPPGPQGPVGPAGPEGSPGRDGVGVASGGTQGQVLTKNSSTDYDTTWSNIPAPDLSNYYTKSETDTAISNAISVSLNGSY